MEWIWNNKEWIFSGIGVVFITFLIALIRYFMRKNKPEKTDQIQIISGGSTGFQIGGNYNEK